MQRILILDSDHQLRSRLVDQIHRTANTEAIIVVDHDDLIARVKFGLYAAIFADADLLNGNMSALIAATRSAITRPMVVIASNEKPADLDPDLVTLVVRKPYDVDMLTGVLLSAIADTLPAATERAADVKRIDDN